MASDFDWTADAVARLRAFWQDEHSTAEIGRRLGISKNAVVGKAHRLGLPPRPSPILGKGTGERPRARARIRPGDPSLPPPRPVLGSAPPYPATDSSPPPWTAPPADQPAVPAAARPTSREPCCWPIGDPGTRGFRTCDAPAQPRKPYCTEHAGVAYVPVQEARGRPAQIAAQFRWDGPRLDRSLRQIVRSR